MKTESTFIPIPTGLPPLPDFNPETHWPRYLGKGVEFSRRNIWLPNGEYTEWEEYGQTNGGVGSNDYLELVAIDFADPAYRAYVEYAYRRGVRIEFRGKGAYWLNRFCLEWEKGNNLLWSDNDYRVAQPAKPANIEADWFGDESQVQTFKAWREWVRRGRIDRTCFERFCTHAKKWVESDMYGWRFDQVYRIKPEPKPPVRVPLDDYRVSEALLIDHCIKIIVEVNGDDIHMDHGFATAHGLMTMGAKIHRGGTWLDCFKVEGGE